MNGKYKEMSKIETKTESSEFSFFRFDLVGFLKKPSIYYLIGGALNRIKIPIRFLQRQRFTRPIIRLALPEGSYSRKLLKGFLAEYIYKEKAISSNYTIIQNMLFCGKKTKKKKVLVIPSWYPTVEKPLVGTFFRDQSNLMKDSFDVVVVFGEPYSRIRKSFQYTSGRIFDEKQSISFVYKDKFYYTEEHLLKQMVCGYEKVLLDLISKGWTPDLLHAHSTVYGGIVASYLGQKYDIPVVITEHQMFLLHNYSPLLRNKIIEALGEADVVAAVSSDKKRAILMHGIKCDPIVVGNLVDDDLFVIKKDTTKKNKKFEILIVAGSSYIKDLSTFLKAIKSLKDRGIQNIHATILGGGLWGNEKSDKLAESLGIADICTFIDSVDREKMVDFYNNCDVFVSTSIAEGFQVSILEAMACGKPVVSTAHGGVEDIMSDENGILVPVRDYRAVADGIIAIKQRAKIFNPQRIRKIVVDSYGRRAFNTRTANIYKNLIENNDR